MSPKGVKKVVVDDETPKVTPTELSKYVNKNLMMPLNKAVIFKSFMINVYHSGDFIKHCIKNIDGEAASVGFFESIINECKERINTQIDIDLQKQKTIIELAEKAITNIMERKAAIDKL